MISKLIRLIPRRYRLKIKEIIGYSSYANFNFKVEIKKTKSPKHFHFANIVGSHRASNLLEPSLAKFLVERGHKVSVTLCDAALPACLACSIWNQAPKRQFDDIFDTPQSLNLCGGCFSPAKKSWETTGAKILKLSDSKTNKVVTNNFIDKLLIFNGVDLSEDVIAGCLRFLCKGNVSSISQELWNAYSDAAVTVASFYDTFFDNEKIDLVISVHGIYIPHGIVNKIMKQKDIEFYNYNTSYREKRFYFTRNNTYHHILPTETDKELNLSATSDEEIALINDYLLSRSRGSQDWQQFNNEPDNNVRQYLSKQNFRMDKPTAVLFTNVVWDARLHFFDNTYQDMVSWINDTIKTFSQMPERNLIIRTHPGEVISHSKSRERLKDLESIKYLPDNVIFIDAEEKISSYELARYSDLNLVYASKVSIELCGMEAPIITCGDAWIKNKSATITPKSEIDYIQYISGDWSNLNKLCNKRNGLAYAHYIFERKPLKFNFLKPSNDRKSFYIDTKSLKFDIENFEENSFIKIENSIQKHL